MKRRLALALLHVSQALGASAVLNGGTHAATMIGPAVTAVGGTVDTSVFVDYAPDPIGIAQLLTASSNTVGTPFFSVATRTPDNHAVYPVLNLSYFGYTIAEDEANYSLLQPQGTILSRPFARAVQAAGTPPPIVEMASSSANSGNGGTGNGIEFALSNSYLGLDTSADSWVSAEVAGIAAQLQANHPTWTWGDLKGALRQTAANWATGYDPAHFGYGAISFASANAIASTSAVYLQPPILVAGVQGNRSLQITVYPFRTSRRVNEVVYLFNIPYSFPVKNEYTNTDIANFVAATGATLVYTTVSATLITNATLAYMPPTGGTFLMIAFTTDGAGNYSRAESFSVVTTPGIQCL